MLFASLEVPHVHWCHKITFSHFPQIWFGSLLGNTKRPHHPTPSPKLFLSLFRRAAGQLEKWEGAPFLEVELHISLRGCLSTFHIWTEFKWQLSPNLISLSWKSCSDVQFEKFSFWRNYPGAHYLIVDTSQLGLECAGKVRLWWNWSNTQHDKCQMSRIGHFYFWTLTRLVYLCTGIVL